MREVVWTPAMAVGLVGLVVPAALALPLVDPEVRPLPLLLRDRGQAGRTRNSGFTIDQFVLAFFSMLPRQLMFNGLLSLPITSLLYSMDGR